MLYRWLHWRKLHQGTSGGNKKTRRQRAIDLFKPVSTPDPGLSSGCLSAPAFLAALRWQ
ncbi:hypothetical protein KCP69_04200 [Salmonella enterica subsp. enterica]|nr:hypothetical protein KCP69_04200 [Salmonella enterica subsp. enterica]